MKRTISFLLCLIMCFSVFSGTIMQVSAAGVAENLFSVKQETVSKGQITYTVSIKGTVESFGGAVILVAFDNNVLAPAEDGFKPACKSTGVQQFKGMYVNGMLAGSENIYSVGYTNTTPEKVSSSTEFFSITFDVINEERPTTQVEFYCREFASLTDAEQTITVDDGDQLIASFTDVTTLEAPKPKSATLITNAIHFKWDAVEGATRYEVRKKTVAGSWEVCPPVSADVLEYTDYSLESGNTYVYSVRAINDYSLSMFDSTGVSCKFIAKPESVTAINGVNGVDITWNKCNGVDKYQITRRVVGTEEWEIIAEPSAKATSYTDTTAENSKSYEYDVNSVLGTFVTGTIDGETCVVTYLPSPVLKTENVKNISEGIELKWDSIDNVAYYTIYRRLVGESEFVEYDVSPTNSFIDYDGAVETGKAYTYSVQAVSADGSRSAFTMVGISITRVPAATINQIDKGVSSITVSWDALEGVDGYRIYRKAAGSNEWEKAGSMPKTATSFEDKGAISGKTYSYCVTTYVGNSESAKIPYGEDVYFLKAPQNVVAENVKDAIKVSWVASAGAIEYEVYRYVGASVNAEKIATLDVGVTEFLDDDVNENEIYSYYVVATNEYKGERKTSELSSPIKRILCVEKIKVKVNEDGIMVMWAEHIDAESYIVCRKANDGMWIELAETISLEYVDTTAKSGNTYAYAVKPVVDGYLGGIDEDAVKPFKYLVAPVISGVELTSDSIKVKWGKVEGAKSYILQRAPLDSDGDRTDSYKTIKTLTADKTSYEDENVSAGKSYAYRVYAVDGAEQSLASAGYNATFLATQSVKSLANAYGGVKITWSKTSGAKNYLVYRKESGGDWVLVQTLSSSKTSYTDKGAKNGVKTYYAVKAKNGNSISTYKSKTFTYFASPEVKVANHTSAISVTWGKISGAKSYYVYRIGPGDSSWKKVATVTKNTYTDTKVKNGKYYTYTVKAYNGSILSGYNTDGWKIKRLTAPSLKSISNSTSGVTIKWGKVTGASKYIVMRKASVTSKWEEIATTTSTSYTDKKATAGKTYIYTVKAGYSSHRSTYIADGLKIKRLSRPSLVSVKSAKKGITFTWKQVTGASGYYVYRKTGSGDWVQIAKVSGKTKVSYVDTTAKKGKTYYYSVRAYSGSYKSAYNTSGLKIKDKY